MANGDVGALRRRSLTKGAWPDALACGACGDDDKARNPSGYDARREGAYFMMRIKSHKLCAGET